MDNRMTLSAELLQGDVNNKKMRKKASVSQIVLNFVTITLLLLTLFPFYVMIINAFKSPTQFLVDPLGVPTEWVFSYFAVAWEYVKYYFINTMIIAVAEVVLAVLVNGAAAYGFARFRFKGRDAMFMCVLAIMMIPGILTLIPQYALVHKLGLSGSLLGVILPQIASPFSIFLLKNFFQGLPQEVFEAAEIDGASGITKFFRIAMPLAKPILFTVGLTTLMGCWNDLIWPRLILLGHEDLYTISVGIMELTNMYGNESFGMGVPLAAYCIVSLPLLVAFFFTSKQFIKGLSAGAIKM